jgi:hypothetical protein
VNFEEFGSKLKFLFRFYANKLKYAWNSNNLETIRQSYWIWMENGKFWMKSMKVHVGMVVIPPIWWPLDGFQDLHHVEYGVKFTFF